MKGLFIPEITAEMFRNGCLESIEALMAEGEIYDIDYTGWIPCSVMIPSPEDMYQAPDQRYLCQLEAYGQKKFCVCSRLRGKISPFWDWYGVPVKDSEVVAWMPLPKPYKGEET